MNLDVAVFGCGYAGSQWAKVAVESPKTNSVYCVDPDPSQIKNISDIPVNFISMNVLSAEESFSNTEQTQFRVLSQCDLWIVAVKRGIHHQLIELANSCNIETILVEKPVYQRVPSQLPIYNVNVCVNYVETVSPVFKRIIDQISEDRTVINRAFHWRGKDSRSSIGPNARHNTDHPAVQEDLVHDLSELYIGFSLLNQPNNFELSSIETCIPWKSVEYNNTKPFTYLDGDAWAKLVYTTNTGRYTVQGGFIDNHTRRFFLWIDTTNNIAYYGNTLLRDYTYPMAYKITGKNAINAVVKELQSGQIITKEDEQTLFNSVSAEPLLDYSRGAYTQNFYSMFEVLTSGGAVPTLQDAYHIEKLTDQFYTNAPVNN